MPDWFVSLHPVWQALLAGLFTWGVTALGADLEQARERAYEAVARISFENSYYRTDIAVKGLRRTQ